MANVRNVISLKCNKIVSKAMIPRFSRISVFILSVLFLISCDNKQSTKRERLEIISTTSIVGDVVSNIAGDKNNLQVLLPRGSSPHGFDPSPKDLARLNQADLIFINGFGLESSLEKILHNQGNRTKIISVSSLINPEKSGVTDEHMEDKAYTEELNHSHKKHAHDIDPHVWMNPENILKWIEVIENSLVKSDPVNQEFYKSNAELYRSKIRELDAWIQNRVDEVAIDERKIVTDHLVFGYFTDHYQFKQVGAIIQGFSTLSQPSAREIAELEDDIRKLQVKSILVGKLLNPALAEQIASDTGVEVIPFYSGSLSEKNGEAGDYISFMKYNVNAIVRSCKNLH